MQIWGRDVVRVDICPNCANDNTDYPPKYYITRYRPEYPFVCPKCRRFWQEWRGAAMPDNIPGTEHIPGITTVRRRKGVKKQETERDQRCVWEICYTSEKPISRCGPTNLQTTFHCKKCGESYRNLYTFLENIYALATRQCPAKQHQEAKLPRKIKGAEYDELRNAIHKNALQLPLIQLFGLVIATIDYLHAHAQDAKNKE